MQHPQKHETRLNFLTTAIENGSLFQVQQMLNALHPAEIAHLIESSPVTQRKVLWELVESENEGEVLIELGEEVRNNLVQDMETGEVVEAVKNLDVDDLADFLQSLPDAVIAETLAGMDRQNRQRVEAVLAYPEDTAGGMMDTHTITIRPDVAVDVILRYLRRQEELPSHTDSVFIVDRYDNYQGVLPINKLLTSQPDTTAWVAMDKQVQAIRADMSAQDVASLFEDRDLISAPVVDNQGKLIGRITVDDVVDVIREEAEHSVRSAAGLDEEDDLFAPVISSSKRRAIWLGTNLLTALFASSIIGQFQNTIDAFVALAVLMPIVASMGGIAGTQTLTLVTRAIALGQLSSSNTRSLFNREVMVSIINGFLWAFVVGIVAWLWFNDYRIGLLIGVAMVINLFTASSFGVMIPLTLKRLNIDPALAGGVILTTITDVVGFVAFLGLATLFLF
jgi:magnesium transporter